MAQNIMEIKNPGGSNHFEKLVSKLIRGRGGLFPKVNVRIVILTVKLARLAESSFNRKLRSINSDLGIGLWRRSPSPATRSSSISKRILMDVTKIMFTLTPFFQEPCHGSAVFK